MREREKARVAAGLGWLAGVGHILQSSPELVACWRWVEAPVVGEREREYCER